MQFLPIFKNLFIILIILLIFNEFLIYYIVLYSCNWPKIDDKNPSISGDKKLTEQQQQQQQPPSSNKNQDDEIAENNNHDKPLHTMILSDTHLIGPFRGHWLDKLRRHWQMYRTFQTSMTLFKPEVVFILGDLFDEGEWVNHEQFTEYMEHFQGIFHTPPETVLYGIVGNHDVGFHYKLNSNVVKRFKTEFNHTSAITIRGINFIRINSMAMHGDSCEFCAEAERELRKLSKQFKCSVQSSSSSNADAAAATTNEHVKCSKPILLQHFPTYRASDSECIEFDSSIQSTETFRENWEVLSKRSTRLLGELLEPRVTFNGHSHHYCRSRNLMNIEEYTVASYNWRNLNNPSFLLVTITQDDYAVSLCRMPKELTVMFLYIFGLAIAIFQRFIFNKLNKIIWRFSRVTTTTATASIKNDNNKYS